MIEILKLETLNRKRIINHLSGVGILTPYDVAQITNVFMFNLIYYNNPIYVGIVPIDFPNYNLINAIIVRFHGPSSITMTRHYCLFDDKQ